MDKQAYRQNQHPAWLPGGFLIRIFFQDDPKKDVYLVSRNLDLLLYCLKGE
jgi:hypothetical protein